MIVRSPASSANLGPGFDCFGIAWQLYNYIEFSPADKLTITGCDKKYRNSENLAYRAFALALKKRGIEAKGVKIDFIESNIPVSRGLGSSSALTVAGALAADRMFSLAFTKEELLEIATEIEGHPDNVAPALLGGLTASTMVGNDPVTVHFPLSAKLHFAALVPPFELSTALARSVLPACVTRADAVFNVSRAALVLSALGSGNAELLGVGMEDRVHQPYRFPLIDGHEQAEDIVRQCGGKALCISGAGSTLLAVSDTEDLADRLNKKISPLTGWRVISLKPEHEGASVV